MAIGVSCLLIILKLIAWHITKSVSVQASMFDSTFDALTSFMNFLALRYSLRPADSEHRWGHGKAEALAGFTQGMFISLFSCFLIFSIVHRLFYPEPLTPSLVGIGIVIFGIVLTLILVSWQKYVVRKTGSLIVKADSVHYETDLLSNSGILLSLYVSMKFNFIYVDFMVGVLIAVYLITSVWKILWTSVDVLMDKELDQAIRQRIIELTLAHPQVKEIHNMRTRSGGVQRFVQFAITLNKTLSSEDMEKVIHDVHSTIHAVFPDMDITIV
ncbi:MAG: cation diffusion facilitator family transporter [Pseudomonadota bacterium]